MDKRLRKWSSRLRLANEQEKNVNFVQFIENHTCLYDITSPFIHGKILKKKRGMTFQK